MAGAPAITSCSCFGRELPRASVGTLSIVIGRGPPLRTRFGTPPTTVNVLSSGSCDKDQLSRLLSVLCSLYLVSSKARLVTCQHGPAADDGIRVANTAIHIRRFRPAWGAKFREFLDYLVDLKELVLLNVLLLAHSSRSCCA